MLPKGITASEALKYRVQIYESVIRTASQHSLSKDEVPKIAEGIWNAVISVIDHTPTKPVEAGKASK